MKKIFKKSILLIITILIIYIGLILVYKLIIFPKKYCDIVEQACMKYSIEPNLVYSIIKQESKFNKNAKSFSGAKGLMQLMDSTAKDMAKKIKNIDSKNINLYDPKINIEIGTKYLSYLLNHFENNYYLAIAAYNAGMGKIDKWVNNDYSTYTDIDDVLKIIEYSETKTYLRNVINNLNYYNILY